MKRVFAWAALLLLSTPALGNPADTYGLGARNAALAGAATAAVDGDSSATYYNPAALATAEAIRIDIGYQLASPSLSMSLSQNGGNQGVDAFQGLVLGAVVPGHIGPVKLAIGIGLELPDGRLIRLRTIPPLQPRWMIYDNRPQRFFFSSDIAFALSDTLFIGGGISYMARTRGNVVLSGRLGFPDATDSQLTVSVDDDLVAVRYPNAGILWRAAPWLDVGLSYRGSFALAIDQGFAIHADIGPVNQPLLVGAVLSLGAISLEHFQPLELSAGFAARFLPWLRISGDVTYARWSDYENPSARVNFTYDLGALNPFVGIPPPAPLSPALFHDILIPRLGVEMLASRRVTMRAGYSYEPSPAPEQRADTNFVDNDKHTLAAGLGLRFFGLGEIVPRPVDIDLFFAATFLPDRNHRKLSAADPVGDYVSSGHVLSTGLETRWRF